MSAWEAVTGTANKVIGFVKSPKHLAFVWLPSAVLLLCPAQWLHTISLDEVALEYRPSIGTAFLITSCALLIEALGYLRRKIAKLRTRLHHFRNVRTAMAYLDPEEKGVLREFLLQTRNTVRLPIDQPVVAGLIHKGILKVVSDFGEISPAGTLFPCNMTDAAISQLRKELVDWPGQKPTDEDIRRLQKTRPSFVQDVWNHEDRPHRLLRGGRQ